MTFYYNKFFATEDEHIYQFLENEGDLFKRLYEMNLLNDIHVHEIDVEHLPLLPSFWIAEAESLEKINRVNREHFFWWEKREVGLSAEKALQAYLKKHEKTLPGLLEKRAKKFVTDLTESLIIWIFPSLGPFL